MCERECKREHIMKTYNLQIYNSQEQITFKQNLFYLTWNTAPKNNFKMFWEKPLEVFFQIKILMQQMCHMSVQYVTVKGNNFYEMGNL